MPQANRKRNTKKQRVPALPGVIPSAIFQTGRGTAHGSGPLSTAPHLTLNQFQANMQRRTVQNLWRQFIFCGTPAKTRPHSQSVPHTQRSPISRPPKHRLRWIRNRRRMQPARSNPHRRQHACRLSNLINPRKGNAGANAQDSLPRSTGRLLRTRAHIALAIIRSSASSPMRSAVPRNKI